MNIPRNTQTASFQSQGAGSTINDVLMRNTPYMRRIAGRIATEGLPAEDVLQSMYLTCLEKAAKSPKLAEVKEGYSPTERDHFVAVMAGYAAKSARRDWLVYNRYIGELVEKPDLETPDFENGASIDLEDLADDTITPESAAENNELISIILEEAKRLGPKYQLIVEMTFGGYKAVEIAARLNISKSRVSQSVQLIRSRCARLLDQ